MNQTALQLNENQYERIGEFVRLHFHQWLLEDNKVNGSPAAEQMNRIENSLEASIVLSRERFEMMDKRFDEQKTVNREHFSLIEKRFEIMDKRFDEQIAFTRERFEAMDERYQGLAELGKERFGSLTKRMNRQFTATLAVTASFISMLGGILYKGLIG